MSTEKIREEFELEIRAKLGGEDAADIASAMLERGSNGEYQSHWVNGAWWGFRKSRESLVIELPQTFDVGVASEHSVMDASEVIEAIHASGVKPK